MKFMLMISIVLPVYNEEGYIGKNTLLILKEVRKICKNFEIIIVEESSDNTPIIAENLAKKYKEIKHFHSDRRLGKGKAIEAGIKFSLGDKIIFMDIDLSVDLSALKLLVDTLDKYDIVVGSRYHPNSKTKRTILRLLIGRSYGTLTRFILGTNVRDFQCGFKGFRKNVAKDVIRYTTSPGVFWDTEILFIAKRLGFSIKEIPVSWIEKKTRSTRIGISTIYTFAFYVIKLFLSGLLRSDQFRPSR